MHVELGMPERLVAVQLGHTDGGKLVRELYGHGDHGALAEIDRYLDAPAKVVPLRPFVDSVVRNGRRSEATDSDGRAIDQ